VRIRFLWTLDFEVFSCVLAVCGLFFSCRILDWGTCWFVRLRMPPTMNTMNQYSNSLTRTEVPHVYVIAPADDWVEGNE
jgi:hypothetical protein